MASNRSIFTLLFVGIVNQCVGVEVHINNGILKGEEVELVTGDGSYYSFKGIPYAQPPVADLRFAPPQPAKAWSGIRSATHHGNYCYQRMMPNGTEDCLYLNVYSPPELKPQHKYPVMVYVHGGAFVFGSGNSDNFSPDFLIPHGVILVTFNYRLEVFGFLSLQSKLVPGNNGLKDQVAVLRWVQENIDKFGGNPLSVTLFGNSAGGASVGYHMVSKISRGLFHKAIVMSGSPLSDWAFTDYPRTRAFLLGQSLGLKTQDDRELLRYLRSLPKEVLVDARTKGYVTPWDTISNLIKLRPFGPTIEKVNGEGGQFLTASAEQHLTAPTPLSNDVPLMLGYTSEEGLLMYQVFKSDYDAMNRYAEYFLTKKMAYTSNVCTGLKVGEILRDHYLNGSEAGEPTNAAICKYYSWAVFKYDLLQFIELLSARPAVTSKRYVYRFNAVTERNFKKAQFGPKQEIPGASHEDDLAYIFHQPVGSLVLNKTAHSYEVIEWMSKLWTNFAKFGNPTPDKKLEVIWQPWTRDKKRFLQIDTGKLSLASNPDQNEYKFWKQQYNTVQNAQKLHLV